MRNNLGYQFLNDQKENDQRIHNIIISSLTASKDNKEKMGCGGWDGFFHSMERAAWVAFIRNRNKHNI